ncbi:hypothetical protein QFC24_004901 [Naganishia onofrii]|uniref:Uncharacterized protein n=1 Tax=Naganishia onofrii TaxID=1851511 RepID=A0ACC2XDX0_9TREE|nr:hypothetical protein QFC24_004901 [Naganishia onofrii]
MVGMVASLFRYTLAAALSASSLFAIFLPLSEATGLTLEQLNSGTGFSYFPIGFGPLLLQPVALAFGKRPVYTNFERPDIDLTAIAQPQPPVDVYPEMQNDEAGSLDEKKDVEHDSVPNEQIRVMDPSFALQHESTTYDAENIKMTKPCAIFGGWLTDWHSMRLAKKANGIFEPEMRCQLLWLPSITTPIGLLMMGLGPHYEAHWIVFVLGMGIVNIGGPFATMIILNYAFDCYHGMTPPSNNKAQAINHQSAPYIIASMIIAMSVAFGYGYAVTPWILGLGFRNFGITTAAVATAFNLSSILIVKYGKWLRKRGQGYYQKMVAL